MIRKTRYEAAHTIANTVESAFYIPGCGMQTAATLAGNAYGAGAKPRQAPDYTVRGLSAHFRRLVSSACFPL